MSEPRPGVPVPPDDLLLQWITSGDMPDKDLIVAAAWGADQQLKLCVEWLNDQYVRMYLNQPIAHQLQSAMRPEPPKPPTLKEQALTALKNAGGADYPSPTIVLNATQASLIREALETLP
jgi:hypothetical protein